MGFSWFATGPYSVRMKRTVSRKPFKHRPFRIPVPPVPDSRSARSGFPFRSGRVATEEIITKYFKILKQ